MAHILLAHVGFHDAFMHFLTEADHLVMIALAVGFGIYLFKRKQHENW
jgi:EamA domain-containing membrane protein RarD